MKVRNNSAQLDAKQNVWRLAGFKRENGGAGGEREREDKFERTALSRLVVN